MGFRTGYGAACVHAGPRSPLDSDLSCLFKPVHFWLPLPLPRRCRCSAVSLGSRLLMLWYQPGGAGVATMAAVLTMAKPKAAPESRSPPRPRKTRIGLERGWAYLARHSLLDVHRKLEELYWVRMSLGVLPRALLCARLRASRNAPTHRRVRRADAARAGRT